MVHLARLELATFGLRVRYSWPIELQVDIKYINTIYCGYMCLYTMYGGCGEF